MLVFEDEYICASEFKTHQEPCLGRAHEPGRYGTAEEGKVAVVTSGEYGQVGLSWEFSE